MPIIGNDTKPAFAYHAYGGSSQPNQEAEDLELPAQRIRILRVGAWIGGWNDSPRVCLCVWNVATGALLAQSGQFSVTNFGSEGVGKVAKYEADLAVPFDTPLGGSTVRVGFTRHRDDKHQVSNGSTINGHYHGRAPYPAGGFAEIDGGFAEDRRIGCWIADYKLLASAKVRRAGAWVDADAVRVRRGAAWADAESVKVYRSGTWQDAN